MRKNIPCPQIVQQYSKTMGGVNLTDMLLSLYRIPCKAKHWYQKIFWHLIDMAKTNAWTLYSRHFRQNGKPHKDQKFLLQFSLELSDALILANKVNESIQFKKTALKTKKFEGTYHEEKAYSGIACHRCSF